MYVRAINKGFCLYPCCCRRRIPFPQAGRETLTQREKPMKDLRLQWAFGAVFIFGNDLRRNRPPAKDNRGNKEHPAPKLGTHDKDEGIACSGNSCSTRSCCRTRATQDFSLGLHWMWSCRVRSFNHGTRETKITVAFHPA
jgi:hypothetical protein